MEALSSLDEDYKDKLMWDLGFRLGLPARIYFVALTERKYLFVDQVGDDWVFWKETFYKTGSYYKEYRRSPCFTKVYDRAWGHMKWLNSEREK